MQVWNMRKVLYILCINMYMTYIHLYTCTHDIHNNSTLLKNWIWLICLTLSANFFLGSSEDLKFFSLSWDRRWHVQSLSMGRRMRTKTRGDFCSCKKKKEEGRQKKEGKKETMMSSQLQKITQK